MSGEKARAINRAWEKWPDVDAEKVAELVSAGWEAHAAQPVPQPNRDVRGWIVVDKTTSALDWDGDLHPTEDAARASLEGDRRFNDPDWKPFEIYDILPVLAALSPTVEGDFHPEFYRGYADGNRDGDANATQRIRAEGLPVTDEMVEKAAMVMFEPPSLGQVDHPEYTWAQMVREDPSRADMWREDARAALSAALGGGDHADN